MVHSGGISCVFTYSNQLWLKDEKNMGKQCHSVWTSKIWLKYLENSNCSCIFVPVTHQRLFYLSIALSSHLFKLSPRGMIFMAFFKSRVSCWGADMHCVAYRTCSLDPFFSTKQLFGEGCLHFNVVLVSQGCMKPTSQSFHKTVPFWEGQVIIY